MIAEEARPQSTVRYTTKKEIALRINECRREIAFLESINTGCGFCEAFDGRGCQRAGGQIPPTEVKATGCPEWRWDEIPF